MIWLVGGLGLLVVVLLIGLIILYGRFNRLMDLYEQFATSLSKANVQSIEIAGVVKEHTDKINAMLEDDPNPGTAVALQEGGPPETDLAKEVAKLKANFQRVENQYASTKLMSENVQKQCDRINEQHTLLYRQIVDIANTVMHDADTAMLQHIVREKWGDYGQNATLEGAIDDQKLGRDFRRSLPEK